MSVRMSIGLARLRRLMYVLLALPVFAATVMLYVLIALSTWIIDGEKE